MNKGVGSTDINLKPAPQAPPSYLTVNDENLNSGNFRKLAVISPLSTNDGGASHAYTISLDTVPITLGGTDAQTAQQAINNLLGFAGLVKGSCLFYDGTNWTLLLPGQEGQGFTIVNGIPTWTNASVPIPSTAAVITADNETATIPNSIQLTSGDGITISHGKVAVDNTVVRNAALLLVQQALIALGQDVIHLEGDQVINGNKLFNELALNEAEIIANGQAYIFPAAGDNLVGEESTQSLSNKTLVSPIIESGSTVTLKTPNGNYLVKTIMPASGRVYSFYDANTDGDIAIKSGNPNAGCMAYGDGGGIRFSAQGSIGQPFISQGINAPTCDVLSEVGGGTNQFQYNPGDMLYADNNGKLQRLAIGKPGQKLEVNLDGTGYIWQ